jgi:hypothetical protein
METLEEDHKELELAGFNSLTPHGDGNDYAIGDC